MRCSRDANGRLGRVARPGKIGFLNIDIGIPISPRCRRQEWLALAFMHTVLAPWKY
jgi:hypothetical protein